MITLYGKSCTLKSAILGRFNMPSMLQMPDEVLLKICSYLSTLDLCVLAGTCQKMRSLVLNQCEVFRERLAIINNVMQIMPAKRFSKVKCVGLTGIVLNSQEANFLRRTIELSMSMLQEIVFYNCTVPWESLTLQVIPESVKKLKVCAVAVTRHKCPVDGWFSTLVMNLDNQQRNSLSHKIFSKKTHCLTNLEWTTDGVGTVDFSEFENSVNFTTPPLKIEVKTNWEEEPLMVLHQSSPPYYYNYLCFGLAKRLMKQLHPLCSAKLPYKVTGLSWNLDDQGVANLAIFRGIGNNASSNGSLLVLPNEVILQILELIDTIDICSMAMTCTRIRKLTRHAALPRVISDEEGLKKDQKDLRKNAGIVGISVLLDLYNLSTMPNLSELVLHDCKVLVEDLQLSNFPSTLLKLKLIHLHVCQEVERRDAWLVSIMHELEQVRHEVYRISRIIGTPKRSIKRYQGMPRIEHFQYRTKHSEPLSQETFFCVLKEIKSTFNLFMWSGLKKTTTILGTTLNAHLSRNFINHSSFKTMLDNCERPNGFLWEAVDGLKANLTLTVWDYARNACFNWN